MVRLALDAGHGLGTPGKRLLKSLDKNETREWVLNNRVANHVEDLLKGYEGVEVLRVDDRTGKRDVLLSERTKKANDWKAHIYISIHHNAGINGGSGGGITVYRYPNSSKMTKSMLQNLYNAIVKHTKLKGNRSSPVNDTNFQVLRQTHMAAALIENGFMDSRTDVPIILTDAHARKAAQGIVEFIVDHFKLKKKPTPAQTKNDGYFRVVVGSYKNKKNAEEQQARLKAKGFDSFLAYYE